MEWIQAGNASATVPGQVAQNLGRRPGPSLTVPTLCQKPAHARKPDVQRFYRRYQAPQHAGRCRRIRPGGEHAAHAALILRGVLAQIAAEVGSDFAAPEQAFRRTAMACGKRPMERIEHIVREADFPKEPGLLAYSIPVIGRFTFEKRSVV